MRIRTRKQTRSDTGGPSNRFKNRNTRVDQSVSTTVIETISSIDGGENTAFTYLQREFLSKYCDETLVPGDIRRQNAIRKFLECEEANRATNLWLDQVDPEYNILPRVTWKQFLSFTRRLIRDILGPLRDEVVLGSFSGGASTSRRRTESHPAQKFSGKADLTEGVWKFLDILYREAPILRQYTSSFTSLVEVRGSELFTVPKKTDIDRCACKEPDINMFLQKGAGSHIRRRLRRFNINLNDQTVNRQHAYNGSFDRIGGLATLDLSSASDRISINCVKALLPTEWFDYLNDIRSHEVKIDGEYHRMEMFSSMGNGFTFELESLIFFALMRAVSYFMHTPGIVSVYGDDIIIPKENADLAESVLQRFGFVVNTDKSFSSGPFRESCGGHYHNGEDITPFYLKRSVQYLTDIIRVANQLRRWAFADSFRRFLIPGLYQSWCRLRDMVPQDLWGGYDYSLDTKLVTPPQFGKGALQRISTKERLDPQGSYLHWHNSNWNRTQMAEPSAEPVSTNQICRFRRTPPGAPACQDWFCEELL